MTILETWKPRNVYQESDTVREQELLYAAKQRFLSGIVFDENRWVLLSDDPNSTSILPSSTISASQDLTMGSQIIMVDSNAGDVTLQLPFLSGNEDVNFIIKRISDDTNKVVLRPKPTEEIDGSANDLLLSLVEDSVWVRVDAGSWRVITRNIVTVASVAKTGSSNTQPVSGSPAIMNGWDDNVVSTPGKLEADQANNQIDVLSVGAVNLHRVHFSVSFTFANNQDVFFELYNDSQPTGIVASETGRGSATTMACSFDTIYNPTSIGIFDVRVTASSSSNVEYKVAQLVIERIRG